MEWFSMSKDSAYCLALLQSYKSENISGAWRITYNIESHLKTYKDFYNNFLIYCKDSVLNEEQLFYCDKMNLPYNIRKALIQKCDKKSLCDVSQQLFEEYVKLADIISSFLSKYYKNIFAFCCIHNYDFCFVSAIKVDFETIKTEVSDFLNTIFATEYDELYHDLINENIFNKNSLTRFDLIRNDRSFVRHHPNYSEYLERIISVQDVKCGSPERKMELSLFSSLILKDLTEATHLYWLYESGEVRREISEITHIIFERDQKYFKYLDLFCQQADSQYVFHDWIWCLVFLTQSLLSSIKHRSVNECKDNTEILEHNNFFGFIPVIEDTEDNNSEVMSFFTRHISRKFCHGFLVVPSNSIYNIPKYLPAYIHEFFHYIPPKNRNERNQAILTLVLHAILSDLRCSLSSPIYEVAVEMFFNELIKYANFYELNESNIFDCDSMEYLERIRNVFMGVDFELVYDTVFWGVLDRYNNADVFNCFRKFKKTILECFNNSALNYIITFVMFFREIRSDIAMCAFFNMDLSNYIRILAEEPLFAALPKNQCADSTIMRFGFMCRYLVKKQYNDVNDWKKICRKEIDLIAKNQSKLIEDDLFSQKLRHLKEYLDEYESISIELEEGNYTPLGQSFLEDFLSDNNIISTWESSVSEYLNHSLPKEICSVYINYMQKTHTERMLNMCGIRFLFRDLYLFNPNIDKD